MPDKDYYSARHGRRPQTPRLSFEDLKHAIKTYLLGLEYEGFFQQHLGHHCVDSGFTPGAIGGDPGIEVQLALGKPHLWPIATTIEHWSEDDLFDMIEFLYANVSKPTDRHWHQWNQCGWHCTAFDAELGRLEFRRKINSYLGAYSSGFELSAAGEVLAIPPTGLESLVAAEIEHQGSNVVDKVNAAVNRFRRHRSTIDDRRNAVRELADVLEYLRPQLKEVLATQDEKDLFNIANNFGIRHHRVDQKTEYDLDIWLDWIFYHFLATVHAAIRLIGKGAARPSS